MKTFSAVAVLILSLGLFPAQVQEPLSLVEILERPSLPGEQPPPFATLPVRPSPRGEGQKTKALRGESYTGKIESEGNGSLVLNQTPCSAEPTRASFSTPYRTYPAGSMQCDNGQTIELTLVIQD